MANRAARILNGANPLDPSSDGMWYDYANAGHDVEERLFRLILAASHIAHGHGCETLMTDAIQHLSTESEMVARVFWRAVGDVPWRLPPRSPTYDGTPQPVHVNVEGLAFTLLGLAKCNLPVCRRLIASALNSDVLERAIRVAVGKAEKLAHIIPFLRYALDDTPGFFGSKHEHVTRLLNNEPELASQCLVRGLVIAPGHCSPQLLEATRRFESFKFLFMASFHLRKQRETAAIPPEIWEIILHQFVFLI